MRRMLVAPMLLFASLARGADDPVPPALTDETFEVLLGEVLPSAEECEFEAVGWRTSFGAAVEEAGRRGRPVLLWAMNGHPLGCT